MNFTTIDLIYMIIDVVHTRLLLKVAIGKKI